MIHPIIERRRAGYLLATAAIWLIAVTLCSTRTIAGEDHDDDEHTDHCHHSTPASEHHDDGANCGCSCQSFNAFPLQSGATNLVKAPAPSSPGPLFLFAWTDEVASETTSVASFIESTGPPERLSFAELVLQRCRHNHAPPSLT